MESLFELLDGFYGHTADPFTDDEHDVINSAATEIVDSILRNSTDPDEVKSEMDYLDLVKIITGMPFSAEIEKLQTFVQELQDRQERESEERPVNASRQSIVSDGDVDVDVEQLFSGLMQR